MKSNVLNIDGVDRMIFAEEKPKSKVPEWEAQHSKSAGFADLMEDGFGSLYKYSPRMRDTAEVPVERTVNRNVMEQIMQLSEYKDLRHLTVGDETYSVAGLTAFKSILDKVPEEVKQQQQRLQDIQEMIDKIENPLDAAEHDHVQDLLKQLAAQQQTVQEGLEQAADGIRQQARAALKQAASEISEMDSAGGLLAGTEPSSLTSTISAEDKAAVAKHLSTNRKLKDIVKMAGRLKRIAERKQAQKTQYVRQQIAGIEQGNELADLLPEEFLKLADPNLEVLFYKGFTEGDLYQYKMTGQEKLGKGPIIVAVDCSGSMSGTPDIWSKAVALAMYWIARKQKRSFGVLLFNYDVVAEVFIEAGESKVDSLTGLLLSGCSGGTSFERPLNVAVEALALSAFQKADILLITDGLAAVSAPFLENYKKIKKEKQFNCISVLIGGQAAPAVLTSISDQVICLAGDIAGNEDAVFDQAFTI